MIQHNKTGTQWDLRLLFMVSGLILSCFLSQATHGDIHTVLSNVLFPISFSQQTYEIHSLRERERVYECV